MSQKDFSNPNRPTIVVLCGSTRFADAFREANARETLSGRIVLSIGVDMRTDPQLLEGFGIEELDIVKDRLDELHKRKIDLADEVLVLNVGGYLGASTRSEIEYAQRLGKPIRWLEGDSTVDGPERAEYRDPDASYGDGITHDAGALICNKCGNQVLLFKDGGWACSCDSAMFEDMRPAGQGDPQEAGEPCRGILAQAICGCPLYSDTKLVEHHHSCPFPGAAAAAKAWNDTYGPFSRQVRYWKGAREGEGQTSATRTSAQVLGGHTAVIWVKGEGACIALTHIEILDDLCKTCRNPQAIHYCRSCSDGTEPGPGCINCRNTGWCQNPCLPPHRWTRHGHRCCDEASEERPPWAAVIAKCGGPAICVVCKTERAEMAGHAKPARSYQPKDGTQP